MITHKRTGQKNIQQSWCSFNLKLPLRRKRFQSLKENKENATENLNGSYFKGNKINFASNLTRFCFAPPSRHSYVTWEIFCSCPHMHTLYEQLKKIKLKKKTSKTTANMAKKKRKKIDRHNLYRKGRGRFMENHNNCYFSLFGLIAVAILVAVVVRIVGFSLYFNALPATSVNAKISQVFCFRNCREILFHSND